MSIYFISASSLAWFLWWLIKVTSVQVEKGQKRPFNSARKRGNVCSQLFLAWRLIDLSRNCQKIQEHANNHQQNGIYYAKVQKFKKKNFTFKYKVWCLKRHQNHFGTLSNSPKFQWLISTLLFTTSSSHYSRELKERQFKVNSSHTIAKF